MREGNLNSNISNKPPSNYSHPSLRYPKKKEDRKHIAHQANCLILLEYIHTCRPRHQFNSFVFLLYHIFVYMVVMYEGRHWWWWWFFVICLMKIDCCGRLWDVCKHFFFFNFAFGLFFLLSPFKNKVFISMTIDFLRVPINFLFKDYVK